MDGEGMKIGMTPPHPGSFVRTEILEELGLSVTRTAEVLGVPPGHAVRPPERKGGSVAGDGAQD